MGGVSRLVAREMYRTPSYRKHNDKGELVIDVCPVCETHFTAGDELCENCESWYAKRRVKSEWTGVEGEHPCPPMLDPIWRKHFAEKDKNC